MVRIKLTCQPVIMKIAKGRRTDEDVRSELRGDRIYDFETSPFKDRDIRIKNRYVAQ